MACLADHLSLFLSLSLSPSSTLKTGSKVGFYINQITLTSSTRPFITRIIQTVI